MPYNPLASTIICNYNFGRFLSEAIDSALAQDYSNHEVIVVDDGSTDESRTVIAGYGSRIIAILQDNQGQCSALNAAFAASSGHVIFPLDSDDVFLPGRISKVIEALDGLDDGLRQRIVMVRTLMAFWNASAPGTPTSGESVEDRYEPDRFPPARTLHPVVTVERSLLERLNSPVAGTALMREPAGSIFPLPTAMPSADCTWSTTAPTVGCTLDIPATLALYRIHDSNKFLNSATRLEGSLIREIEIFNHLRSLGHDPIMRYNGIRDFHRVSPELAVRFPLRSMGERMRHLIRARVPLHLLTFRLLRELAWSIVPPRGKNP